MYALALTRESFSADEGFGRIANAINAFGPYDLKYRSVEGTRDIRTLWNAAVQSGSSRDMTNAIAQSDVDGFPVCSPHQWLFTLPKLCSLHTLVPVLCMPMCMPRAFAVCRPFLTLGPAGSGWGWVGWGRLPQKLSHWGPHQGWI